ncbi:hypothetical protein BDV98DRAFT_377936 [Pterulicium gracile]|uniref:Uncharacterized protein n=1 Tax=Pterulicium gracile TaxID=1884261 RepID=A0A5C3Q050_9AGAR|nr:hypothetical protein BDV98DRAFT_377936 [Pterula gracilis]
MGIREVMIMKRWRDRCLDLYMIRTPLSSSVSSCLSSGRAHLWVIISLRNHWRGAGWRDNACLLIPWAQATMVALGGAAAPHFLDVEALAM